MTLGWLRCGRLFATSYPRRRQGCWRLVAGRWAALSRRCWMAATTASGSTLKRRMGRTTSGPSSNGTSRPSRWTALWRPCRCITWPTWMRSWTGWRLCWCPVERSWWWSGPGSSSTRPRPAGVSPGLPHRPREGAGLAAQAPGAVGGLRPDLGFLPQGLGDRGGVAPRRGHHAGPGCALRPPVLCGGAVLLPDLADTSEAEEQSAIDARQIRAGGIRYAATRA